MQNVQEKIEERLKEWRKEKTYLPILIKGARQIEESYSIRKFSEENYKHVIEIAFEAGDFKVFTWECPILWN